MSESLGAMKQQANNTFSLAAKQAYINALEFELNKADIENATLKKVLYHIAHQSCAMSTVDFSWQKEWQRLKDEAKEALDVFTRGIK